MANVENILRSSLALMSLDEIAKKLCYASNEIVFLHKCLVKQDLSSYLNDPNISIDNLQPFSFPDLVWSAICNRHSSLYTYPAGDFIERALKRTVAVLLFSDDQDTYTQSSTSAQDLDVQHKLYTISKSKKPDYLLKLFLTYFFFELCIAKLRSRIRKNVDLGYSYHFSNGYLIPLDDQMCLRNDLLEKCGQLADKFLPHLRSSLKQTHISSTIARISSSIEQVFLPESKALSYYGKRKKSKPFVNVIVGMKQKSELGSEYELATNITRIILDGKYKNATFDLGDVSSFLGHSLNSLTKDLLEIGFVIYISDLYVERNPDLSRRLSILIPVRHPDVWSGVNTQLERTVSFLARDDVNIHFTKKKEACDDSTDFGPFNDKKECCCLFSGGLDSAVGAVWALNRGLSPTLISYSSGNLSGIQSSLVNAIEQNTGQSLHHLTVSWQAARRKKGAYRLGDRPNSTLFQHLRSFFYLSLAAAIAIESNCKTLYTFENGPIAINPLISESHINTRTVHPHFLECFQSLINSVFGTNVSIKNPFLYKTKGELIRYLVNKNLSKDLIPLTSSCFSYYIVKANAQKWFSMVDYTGRHCGDCLPCIIKRVSLHHANVPNRYDDYLVDVFNIFDSPIFLTKPEHSVDTIIRTADLLRFCQCFSSMPIHELVINFPDLCVYSIDVDSSKLSDMYKRYSEEVIRCFRDKSSSKFQEVFRTVLAP